MRVIILQVFFFPIIQKRSHVQQDLVCLSLQADRCSQFSEAFSPTEMLGSNFYRYVDWSGAPDLTHSRLV